MTRVKVLELVARLELTNDEYAEFAGHLMRDCSIDQGVTFTRQLTHDDVLKLCAGILRVGIEKLTEKSDG